MDGLAAAARAVPVRIRTLALACLLVLAACGGGGSGGGGQLVIGVLAPFTGQDAALGPAYFAACLPAARAINGAGGVLGHQVTCKQFDTRGDPADAVPAASQMIASTGNLMMVIGCTSDEAASVMPLLERSHVPAFCMTGQSEFDKTPFKYFHRLVPPDAYDAYAMVGIASLIDHYARIALVFGNDIGSQTFVPPAVAAVKALGGSLAINQALDLGQGSYRTEVAQLLGTNPQVILTEALGSTDATYLSQLKQLRGSMIPVIGSSGTVDPTWFQAVSAAIGTDTLVASYQANNEPTTFSGAGYQEFKSNLLASRSQFADAPKYVTHPATLHLYDGVVMTALAMVAAKSTDRPAYNPWIVKVGNGSKGATEVSTFKDGLQALNNGKAIRLIGAGGTTNFNQYNNSQGGYDVVRYTSTGDTQTIGRLTQEQIARIVAQSGG
jgi:ABC-type branched-subunit amino acid transport system substrate-binding protein